MESIKWKALKKDGMTKGQLKAKRKEGFVPSVMNRKDNDSLNFLVYGTDIKNKPAGNVRITLEIEGEKEPFLCFLKKIQRDHANKPINAEFQELTVGQELDVNVNLELVGEAPGVKSGGGFLNTQISTIKIRTLPRNMPDKIEIDISKLKVGDAIRVEDINLGEEYTLIEPTEGIVVSVNLPKEETESENTGEMPTVEILSAKKDED